MLYLHTGLPGHGKTLNTIKEVDAASVEQDRPVYHHNIKGLDPSKLAGEWYEFEDAHKWFELPDNCIIVVDECQDFFPPRDVRMARPDYIAHFQTHRHKGYDIHLITQDFRFIDVEVRRLVGNHVHYWRPYGLSKIARYEYEKCSDFDKVSDRAFAKKTYPTLDKKFFGAYTSAVGHHVKVKLPTRVYLIVAILLVCAFCFYRVYDKISSGSSSDQTTGLDTSLKDTAKDVIGTFTGGLGFVSSADQGSSSMSPAQYVERQIPRVPDIPSSAPIYDELTRPVAYPRLSCMYSSDSEMVSRNGKRLTLGYRDGKVYGCRCNTQQGTRAIVSFDACMAYVEQGAFDPAIADRGGVGDVQTVQPIQSQHQYRPEARPESVPVTVVGSGKAGHLW